MFHHGYSPTCQYVPGPVQEGLTTHKLLSSDSNQMAEI